MRGSVKPHRAVELLTVEHNAVRALIDSLSDEEMTRPDTIRYGLYVGQQCSFKDLLAHLITYEVYALEAIDAWRDGRKHWISDAMESATEGRRVHFEGIAERSHLSLRKVIASWEQTQTDLKGAIRNISDDEWHGAAPYPADDDTDLGGMLEAILVAPPRPMYRHLPVHIPDADAYIRSLRRG